MPTEENTFRAVGTGDERMHGHPAVLIAGFEPAEQKALRELMDELGLEDIALSVMAQGDGDRTLAELAQRPDGTRVGETASLPRTAITSGLTEQQFNFLMDAYRLSGMARPMWATVTPTSEQWTARALLAELLEERKAMMEAAQRKP